jgi:hypothetical protein
MVEKFSLDEIKRMANVKVQGIRNWNIGIMWGKRLRMRCHPEQGKGSLRFFTLFRMTFSI